MAAYYNEHDPKAAAWLRELIKAGAIAPGEVDDRDIRDVTPADLRGFSQCHFFAGLGGWSHALRLARWPDHRPAWTGSCPCQPFSAAGGGAGFSDDRHLWPAWYHLIKVHRPGVIFGEQVASKAALPWLDLVQAGLEIEGYAVGAFDLCAAGVGAPHIRQRLYFVAESSLERREGQRLHLQPGAPRLNQLEAGRSGEARELADDQAERWRESGADFGRFAPGDRPQRLTTGSLPGGHVGGYWRDADWIYCRDEKYRPVEPGSFPLAHGAPARVGRLRGYGNAIVAPLAAEFIAAYMDIAA